MAGASLAQRASVLGQGIGVRYCSKCMPTIFSNSDTKAVVPSLAFTGRDRSSIPSR